VSRLTARGPRRRPAARPGLRALAVGSVALALVVGLASGWGSVPLPVVGLLALVVAAAELVVLPARLGPSRWPVSLTEGAVGACLLVGAGAWSVVAVGLGVAAAQTVRRCPRRKRELDLAVRLVATALAQAACAVAGGGLAGAVVGLTVFWLVGCVLLAAAVTAVSPRPLPALVLWTVRRSALHTAGSAAVGLLCTELALLAPLGLLGVVAGAGAAWSAYAAADWRRGEARLYAHLAQAPERTPDASASLLVTAAARLLGGVDVELVVLDGALPRRFRGDERGRAAPSYDVVALDEPWVLDALGAAEVRRSRDDDDRPALSAVLRSTGRPRAVLRARRTPGAPDFDRSDVRSLEVLVARADAWLAAPPDGTVAPSEPAVGRVRASVDRLDALAGRGAPLPQVAAELHELERAVASLLGAAALPAAAVPRQRPGSPLEWTTTGVVR
jgi:hypothetical protein